MLGFFRKRTKRAEFGDALFAHIREQVDELAEVHGLERIARSFYLHDYIYGVLFATREAAALSRRDMKRGFVDFFEECFGYPRIAGASCYKAAARHRIDNPAGQGFVDGYADGAALVEGREAEGWLRRRFADETARGRA
jgi:hypothetical protein